MFSSLSLVKSVTAEWLLGTLHNLLFSALCQLDAAVEMKAWVTNEVSPEMVEAVYNCSWNQTSDLNELSVFSSHRSV